MKHPFYIFKKKKYLRNFKHKNCMKIHKDYGEYLKKNISDRTTRKLEVELKGISNRNKFTV